MPIKLHYKDIGNSDRVILFLHGLGANADSWHDQIDAFKNEYRLIIPDLRGHGQTALDKEKFSFELCADDLYELLEKLFIEQVDLCGFSMGGMVAFEFAVKYPEKVRSFCVINTLAHFHLTTLKEKFQYKLRQLLVNLLPLPKLAQIMGKKLFVSKDQHLRQRLIEMSRFANKKSYKIALTQMIGWDKEQYLTFITMPALIIGSEFDYSIYDGKERLAERLPQGKFIEIKGAHHFVTWEKADEFNKIYKKFIDSV